MGTGITNIDMALKVEGVKGQIFQSGRKLVETFSGDPGRLYWPRSGLFVVLAAQRCPCPRTLPVAAQRHNQFGRAAMSVPPHITQGREAAVFRNLAAQRCPCPHTLPRAAKRPCLGIWPRSDARAPTHLPVYTGSWPRSGLTRSTRVGQMAAQRPIAVHTGRSNGRAAAYCGLHW